MSKVTLTMRADDAEPILRKAAYEAAKFGAWLDHFRSGMGNLPCGMTAEVRKNWQNSFLSAKRIVESFGVEYEMTSEQETLTVDYRWVGGKRKPLGNTGFMQIVGSKPDYDNPFPSYRREVHSEACHAAARRVVARWRGMITAAKAA